MTEYFSILYYTFKGLDDGSQAIICIFIVLALTCISKPLKSYFNSLSAPSNFKDDYYYSSSAKVVSKNSAGPAYISFLIVFFVIAVVVLIDFLLTPIKAPLSMKLFFGVFLTAVSCALIYFGYRNKYKLSSARQNKFTKDALTIGKKYIKIAMEFSAQLETSKDIDEVDRLLLQCKKYLRFLSKESASLFIVDDYYYVLQVEQIIKVSAQLSDSWGQKGLTVHLRSGEKLFIATNMLNVNAELLKQEFSKLNLEIIDAA